MTFRETREASEGSSAASVGLASTDERETPVPVVDDSEEDTPQAVVEETYAPSPSKGEDPVRLYLKEIGKVSLLTAAQEVEIGRRIEVGQIALRRTLAGIPMAVEALLTVGDQLRRGWEQISTLDRASRRGHAPAAARELRALEKRTGLSRKHLGPPLEQIERSDRTVRQAKRELMEANLRLVVSVAKRYLGSDLSLLDLVQEGNIGLMEAVDRFQYRRGFKFSTYATWWIRQAIT